MVVNQEAELYVGGVGVFAGYLGRDDLTSQSLVKIDGVLFYRTGDLVRLDESGLLHYIGRKDFQVKVRGQRIELGEIERCLLNTSISACVVTKWSDDHLIAYVQSSNANEGQLREHCQSHLPPHMIPSVFIILDKLPVNANGKIDRKQLPPPNFSIPLDSNHTDTIPSTKLEEHLQRIFSDAFHNESPNVNISFGQMGGTSLDVIRALWLIRQQISTKVDASLLFANPSIRQLGRAIELLLITHDDAIVTTTPVQLVDKHDRPMPCLYIELIGILLLICHWISPIWLAYRFNSFFTFLLIPAFHLLSYVICQRLLFRPGEIVNKADQLYSWHYYRWWILNRMWSINNSHWLKHLVGTSFYNSYLRLCGAKIGSHSHIYTTLIDAPWLIEVGESTFIGDDVVFSNLSYQDRTYELHRIRVGSCSTINIRSVLYDNVNIEDRTYIEPMSSVTGHTPTMNSDIFIANRSLSLWQQIYQLACLLSLLLVHSLVFLFTYKVYSCCVSVSLPLSVSLALSWLIWILTSLCVALLLLKYIVGRVRPGHYPSDSYYYLHKLWLRQLIITSFRHAFDFIPSYDIFATHILRWLGAQVGDDTKFAEFQQILYFPSNLLRIENSVTTFGGAKLASFTISKEGVCCVDEVHLGSGTNLTNWCTIMPGKQLPCRTMVGSLTLVTQNTVCQATDRVLLGIPAREMPFVTADITSLVNDSPLSPNSSSVHHALLACLYFFASKCSLIILYSKLSITLSPFIHIVLACITYRYSISSEKSRTQFTFSEVNSRSQYAFRPWISEFFDLISPYLSGTQFLVFLFRALGGRIGCGVILPEVGCLTDPHLVTIGDHVRMNTGAYVQCHTFEQRLLKLAPVNVNHSSVLMSNTLVLPGSILHGHNRILPWTLIMKNDQLPPHTNWYGVPGEQIR